MGLNESVVLHTNVQAYISNISFPKTINGLDYYYNEQGRFDTELIEDASLASYSVEWTAPKWAMPGDIVFFFHAKTALQTIRRLEIEVQNTFLDGSSEYLNYNNGLQHAREVYKLYGGKIFAIGHVLDNPFYDNDADLESKHWKSRVYVCIGDIQLLQNPIPIELFNSFLFISRQSSITPVLGNDFEELKKLICRHNDIPNYFRVSSAAPFPLREINSTNWLELTAAYHRAFQLETAFRSFYVDYFLSAIADKKTIYRECECRKEGQLTGFVDNCIWINSKLCFVEVKINWDAEKNIIRQLEKYCNADEIWIQKGKRVSIDRFIIDKAIVIDRNRVGVFDNNSKQIEVLAILDEIQKYEELRKIRYKIIEYLI